jgi:myosin heavy subunit
MVAKARRGIKEAVAQAVLESARAESLKIEIDRLMSENRSIRKEAETFVSRLEAKDEEQRMKYRQEAIDEMAKARKAWEDEEARKQVAREEASARAFQTSSDSIRRQEMCITALQAQIADAERREADTKQEMMSLVSSVEDLKAQVEKSQLVAYKLTTEVEMARASQASAAHDVEEKNKEIETLKKEVYDLQDKLSQKGAGASDEKTLKNKLAQCETLMSAQKLKFEQAQETSKAHFKKVAEELDVAREKAERYKQLYMDKCDDEERKAHETGGEEEIDDDLLSASGLSREDLASFGKKANPREPREKTPPPKREASPRNSPAPAMPSAGQVLQFTGADGTVYQHAFEALTAAKTKEQEKVVCPPFPDVSSIANWVQKLSANLVTASGRSDSAEVKWIKEVQAPDMTFDKLADSGEARFHGLDTKLSFSAQACVDNAPRDKVATLRSKILGKTFWLKAQKLLGSERSCGALRDSFPPEGRAQQSSRGYRSSPGSLALALAPWRNCWLDPHC